jgi:hypothetical protein
MKSFAERTGISESDKKKAQEIAEKVGQTMGILRKAAAKEKELTTKEAYKEYRSAAGETESRNTEIRALMTKSERLEKMLTDTEDVAREDQIVLGEAAEGLKSAIEENATERKRYKIENADEAGANKNEVERAKKLWDEVGVRSPFFKRWFGDWELAEKLKEVERIEPKYYETTDPKTKGQIKDFFREIKVINNDSLGGTKLSNDVAGKLMRHQGFNISTIIDHFPEIYKDAILVKSGAEVLKEGHKPRNNINQYHQLLNKFKISDGDYKGEYYIRFTVQEMKVAENKKRFEKAQQILHSTFISDVEIYKKETDVESNLSRTTEREQSTPVDGILQQMFKDVKNVSKIVDENGEPEVFYHGTQRADRVGSVFRKDRATSGTMAYFTNDRNIAENYSKNKQDTSRLNEETAYTHWFFVNGLDLESYGKTLTRAQNEKLLEKLKHIGYDYENVSYGETSDAMVDPRHWDMVYREKKGNAIMTAVEVFLNDGNMYNNEKKFIEVLKLLGVKEKDITMDFPTEQYSDVYEVYLNIRNPFNTENIPKEIVKQLEQAAEEAPEPEYIEGVDHWDKNAKLPKEWIAGLRRDIKDGKTYVWTSIPDWVSDVLKANGYDGIIDKGGKYDPTEGHKVVIPFESEQIKSVENRGTFYKRNKDIRYKIEDDISKPLTEKEVKNPERLKKITLITNIKTLRKTAGYAAGKAGNMKAAQYTNRLPDIL